VAATAMHGGASSSGEWVSSGGCGGKRAVPVVVTSMNGRASSSGDWVSGGCGNQQ